MGGWWFGKRVHAHEGKCIGVRNSLMWSSSVGEPRRSSDNRFLPASGAAGLEGPMKWMVEGKALSSSANVLSKSTKL